MKYLIAPDSFKGSLSASEFCKIAEETIKVKDSSAQVITMPLADGGEGTLDCLIEATKGTINKCFVQNSLFDEITVPVGFFDNGKFAIVESALSNGLPQIKGNENPLETSTYGVGQMLGFAVDMGAKNVILTLGGSSTNDCGLGMLAALGACFYNKEGISFVPVGGTLQEVVDFDFSMMYPRLVGARFEAMCDVDNPLCGEKGCSKVFAPQKGSDAAMVEQLEAGCKHIKELFAQRLGQDFSEVPGAGAAGGLGFAVLAGLCGTLKSGSNMVLDLYKFEDCIKDVDCIITGEGSFDQQSLMGKIVGTVIKRSAGKKVAVFCGKQKDKVELPENVQVYEISQGQDLEYAMEHAKENLEKALKNASIYTGDIIK